ncbi:hypothetical protein E3N88_26176 [Mikania micrantha]|uniref:Uncharacterized protein n=1 Tax=Mikania micrantha TaxID=192012 RepID=A0A5N6N7D1_9ASTR|nr:hypothetical protein E3N88_26176 [Mikania micrantha]
MIHKEEPHSSISERSKEVLSFKYTTWILAMQCSWTLMSIRTNHPFHGGKSLPVRDLYQSDLVVASEIVARIMSSKDESVLFEIDFIVLFLTTMVECTNTGKCKMQILNMISKVENFKDINWSGYVVDKLRHCKNNWNRMNKPSYFTGGLTILTLLYVDSFTCPVINIDTKQMHVEFWTTQMLKIRERLEIENGGFGLGELRIQQDQISSIDKKLNDFANEKQKLEKQLDTLYNIYFERVDTKRLLEKYEKIVVEAVMKTHGVDNSPNSGIEGLSDERSQRTRILDEENASIPTFSLGLTQEKEEKGKTKTDKIDEMINASIPSFSLGLTQETQDKGKNKTFKSDDLIDASIPRFSLGFTQETPKKAHGDDEDLITGNDQEKTHKMCGKGDNEAFSIPLGEEHVHKKENVALLNKPTRAKIISEALWSPYVIREVEINKNLYLKKKNLYGTTFLEEKKSKLQILTM